MFETTAEMMIVDGGGEAYNNVSYEICAQNCAYDLSNCTVFEYWKTTGYCRTFNVNPASLTTEAHAEFHIFTRKHSKYHVLFFKKISWNHMINVLIFRTNLINKI